MVAAKQVGVTVRLVDVPIKQVGVTVKLVDVTKKPQNWSV
jgi:hypothetical protein